jgi:hypothetical protein
MYETWVKAIEDLTMPLSKAEQRHDFKVISGAHGKTGFVFMDGELLRGVYDVKVDINAKDAARITISFFANSINNGEELPMGEEEARAIAVLNNDGALTKAIATAVDIETGKIDPERFRKKLLDLGKTAKQVTYLADDPDAE